MNNTLFFSRYIITGYIAYSSIGVAGPLVALGVFVLANILWTLAENGLIAQRNIRETGKYNARQQRKD